MTTSIPSFTGSVLKTGKTQREAAERSQSNIELVSDGTLEGSEVYFIREDGVRERVRGCIRVEAYLSSRTRFIVLRIMNARMKMRVSAPSVLLVPVPAHPNAVYHAGAKGIGGLGEEELPKK